MKTTEPEKNVLQTNEAAPGAAPQPQSETDPQPTNVVNEAALANEALVSGVPAPPEPSQSPDDAAKAAGDFVEPASPSPVAQTYKAEDLVSEDDSPSAGTRVDTEIEIVRVGKTDRFVAYLPVSYFGWIIPEDRDSRRPAHLVAPNIAKAHKSICRRVRFAFYVDPDRNFGTWPILLEDKSGRVNEWNLSALAKVDMALDDSAKGICQWHSIRTNGEGQPKGYGLWRADEAEELGTPAWPTDGMHSLNDVAKLLLNIAFKDRIIADENHEVLRKQRGKRVG
jgi:hypothetical protein